VRAANRFDEPGFAAGRRKDVAIGWRVGLL
jgi:hypothetical protein